MAITKTRATFTLSDNSLNILNNYKSELNISKSAIIELALKDYANNLERVKAI